MNTAKKLQILRRSIQEQIDMYPDEVRAETLELTEEEIRDAGASTEAYLNYIKKMPGVIDAEVNFEPMALVYRYHIMIGGEGADRSIFNANRKDFITPGPGYIKEVVCNPTEMQIVTEYGSKISRVHHGDPGRAPMKDSFIPERRKESSFFDGIKSLFSKDRDRR